VRDQLRVVMIDTMIGAVTISKSRLWTSRVIGGWLALFLAFDSLVKVVKAADWVAVARCIVVGRGPDR